MPDSKRHTNPPIRVAAVALRYPPPNLAIRDLSRYYVLIPSFENAGEEDRRRTTLGQQQFDVLNSLIKEICAHPSIRVVISVEVELPLKSRFADLGGGAACH